MNRRRAGSRPIAKKENEMKTWKTRTILARVSIVFAAALTIGAALAVATSNEKQRGEGMTREITFLPDRVYEVTGIWVKDGKMD